MLKSSRGRVTIAAAGVVGLLAALLPIAVLTLDQAAAVTDPTTAVDDNGTLDPTTTSLREAIGEASSDGVDSVINLDPALGVYVLDICDPGGMDNAWGDLNHDGAGTETLTINGNGATIRQECLGHRILRDRSSGQLTLDNVTITGGREFGSGGGVKTDGPATLQNGTHIVDNTATGSGGGIYMRELSMAGKPDADDGLEAAEGVSGALVITGVSTVNGNAAVRNGGGVGTYGSVEVSGTSAVDGNIAGIMNPFPKVDGADLPPEALDCNLYGGWGYGGGIYAHSVSPISVLITGESSVSDNIACYAGGGLDVAIYTVPVKAAEPADATLVVSGASKVNGNFAHSDGGGIHTRASTAIIGGSMVDANQAGFVSEFELAPADADPALCDGPAPKGGGRHGGGIFYYPFEDGDGAVYVVGSSVSNNVACGDGGGIYYYPTKGTWGLTSVTASSTVNSNTAVGEIRFAPEEVGGANGRCGGCGGGIFGSDVEVFDSQVSMNDAGWLGGGISSTGQILAVRSGINLNTAGLLGGGLLHYSERGFSGGAGAVRAGVGEVEVMRLNNTTVSSNSVEGFEGGGIYVPPGGPYTVTLEFATVVENTAQNTLMGVGPAEGPPGAPIDNIYTPTLASTASVIALPGGGNSNCWQGATSSGGYNFSDDASCGLTGTGDVEDGGDPGLGALTGVTGWHVPTTTSPLVDAVPLTLGASAVGVDDAACDDTDQRAMGRPSGLGCDVGAVELQFPTAIDNTGTTSEGVAVTIPVLDNDEDPDGVLDPSTVAVVDTIVAEVGTSAPASGVAVVNPDGSITYTPNPGFSGVDGFGYTVMITGTTTTVAANVTITVTAQPVDPTPTPAVPPGATPTPTPVAGPIALQPQFTG